MRNTYQLTNETREVLSGNVKQIAAEMDVSDKYLYGILAGTETDPFAPFRRMFRGAARAGAPSEIWRDELAAIEENARGKKPAAAAEMNRTLLEKLRVDAAASEELAKAIADGVLDERECHILLATLNRSRAVLDEIEANCHARLGELANKNEPNLRRVK